MEPPSMDGALSRAQLHQNEKRVMVIKIISGIAALVITGMSTYNCIHPLPYFMQTLASFYLM